MPRPFVDDDPASGQIASDHDKTLVGIALLIPAWDPPPTFPALVADLAQRGFGRILLVDDGSAPAHHAAFAQAAAHSSVDLLRHPKNLGKGRALKTGFAHILQAHPELEGIVTADADGQHTPEDIARVARTLAAHPTRPVLGSRSFSGPVPFRSRAGNALMRSLFKLLTGISLRDTQTGLRGFPTALLPELLQRKGERYEYEMSTLAQLCREGNIPIEIPIATVYLDGNRSSRFHPIRDSLRFSSVLLRLSVQRARKLR